jgi:hypothetical protein
MHAYFPPDPLAVSVLPPCQLSQKSFPPMRMAGTAFRRTVWREETRVGFSSYRQAIFSNTFLKGSVLTILLDRGLHL